MTKIERFIYSRTRYTSYRGDIKMINTTLDFVLQRIRQSAEERDATVEQLYRVPGTPHYRVPGSNANRTKAYAANYLNTLLAEAPPANEAMTPEQRQVAQAYQPDCGERAGDRQQGRSAGCLVTLGLAGLIAAFAMGNIKGTEDHARNITELHENARHARATRGDGRLPPSYRAPIEVAQKSNDSREKGRDVLGYATALAVALGLGGFAYKLLKRN